MELSNAKSMTRDTVTKFDPKIPQNADLPNWPKYLGSTVWDLKKKSLAVHSLCSLPLLAA